MEADIVAGGETLVITLTNDTWDATVGADNAITTALINGIDSDGLEGTGWNAVVKAGLTFNEVTRTSSTVVTVTLPAFASYDVTIDETITVTVPAIAVANAIPIMATPTFDIVAAGAPIAQVQKATGASVGDTTSVTATYGAAPTQGNLLVLVHHYRDTGTVTLPAGWTQAVALVDSGSTITIAYKVAGAAEGTGVMVSVAEHQTITIFEYSGIVTAAPLDRTASNPCSANVTSCSSGTTATTAQADELVIAAIGLNGTSGGWANTWTNLFTQQSTAESTGGGSSQQSASSTADRIVTTTGTFETTESWANNNRAQGAIATFKAAP